MALIRNENSTYTFEGENRTVTFTANEMSLLVNQYMHISLRDSIEYELKNADGDTIQLDKYPYSYEDLVDEIYLGLSDDVDCGVYPSDEDIQERIADVACYYDMELD